MTGPMTDRTIATLLDAAEPGASKALAGLIERLATEGRLRGAWVQGAPAEPAALAGLAVHGVTNDSRTVVPGALFVAVPGAHTDGHDHLAAAAAARGRGGRWSSGSWRTSPLPQLVVAATQPALATAAAWWYRRSESRAPHDRHHRDGRQDDHVVPRRRRP